MTDPLDIRRRRAIYRAAHRGTKEMDWLIGRFADALAGVMEADQLALFEALLETPDPVLERWILKSEPADPAFAELVASIRRFHGL